MPIGGLDIGTTGCKLSVYDSDGRFITQVYSEYSASRVAGEHELSADSVWASVCTVIREMSSKVPDLDSIGVTSFGESFVMLDENDEVLAPAMLYTDPRGGIQCAELVDRVGKKELGSIVGLSPHQMFSLPKLMWIRDNRSDLYNKAKRILLFQDFTVYRLTGVAQIDYSLASRTMAFDIRERTWSNTVFEAAGIDRNLFSTPVASGTLAGKIRPGLASGLGLSPDVLIASCCHDQVSAAIGAGVFEEGDAIDGTGTVECITPVFNSIPDMDILQEGYFAVVPHAVKDKYVSYAFCFTGGHFCNGTETSLPDMRAALRNRQDRMSTRCLIKAFPRIRQVYWCFPILPEVLHPIWTAVPKGQSSDLRLSTHRQIFTRHSWKA